MCGICGLLAPDVADPALVEAMNDAIVHRGPDHGAVAAYGRCMLGYRRLSIIDLQTGDQPLENENGCGRRGLQRRALQLPRAPARARGEGARDPRHRRLAADPARLRGVGRSGSPPGSRGCSRSRSGTARPSGSSSRATGSGRSRCSMRELPDGSLAFASETKALLRLPTLPRELDLQQLDAYLALQYVPRSGLKAVEKVPPGSFAVAEGGAVRVERYWRPRPAAGLGTDEEWVERVHDEVTAAVRRRLVSDVPLGALLSGGLDSSIVVVGDGGRVPRAGEDLHDRLPGPPLRRAVVRARRRRAVRDEPRGARGRPGARAARPRSPRRSTSRSATRRRCRRCSSARRPAGT